MTAGEAANAATVRAFYAQLWEDGDLSCLPYRQDRGAQIFRTVASGGALPLVQQTLVSQRTANIHLNAGRDETAPDRGFGYAQIGAECSQLAGGRFGETHDAFIMAMCIQPIRFARMVTPSATAGATAWAFGQFKAALLQPAIE